MRDLPDPGEPELVRDLNGIRRHGQLAVGEHSELDALHGDEEALLLDTERSPSSTASRSLPAASVNSPRCIDAIRRVRDRS